MRYFACACASCVLILANDAFGEYISPDSILTSYQSSISVRTPSGTILQQIPVPYPGGARPATEYTRDLVMMEDGRIAVFNGTFDPYLSIYDPQSASWTHTTFSGWSQANNIFSGCIATYGPYVFVSDSRTFGSDPNDELRGAIRFDTRDMSAVRFSNFRGQNAVGVGLDGKLYVSGNGSTNDTQVDVYDPVTLQFERSIFMNFSGPSFFARDLSATANGDLIVSADIGRIIRFDPSGNFLGELVGTGGGDMDLVPDGRILYPTRFSGIFGANLNFGPPTFLFNAPERTFVAFAIPEPATLLLLTVGLATLARR